MKKVPKMIEVLVESAMYIVITTGLAIFAYIKIADIMRSIQVNGLW